MYIDYNEIDVLIKPFIELLNDNGVYTKYSCQGHRDGEKMYVMFEDGTREDDILFLLDVFDLKNGVKQIKHQVKLYYWIRGTPTREGRKSNWMFEVNIFKESERKEIIDDMTKRLRCYFNLNGSQHKKGKEETNTCQL